MMTLLILPLTLSTLSVLPVRAQDEENAKNLYLARAGDGKKGKPGMKVRIKLKRRGNEQWVPMNFTFREGDQVKFFFEANFSAYVKALNLGTTGKVIPLFPYEGAEELLVKNKSYELPQGDVWIKFDHNPGQEQLVFIFSAEQLLSPGSSSGAGQNNPRQDADGDVTVNVTVNQQQALTDLNSRALENSKDMTLYQEPPQSASPGTYAVVNGATLKKPRRLLFTLRHR